VGKESFFEVYVQCPIDVCAERDQKGIYAKAKERIIKEFTGISAPYEPPEKPSLVIASNLINPIESADFVVNTLRDKNIIP
jgi:adenylylsulfate kinase